MRIEMMGYLGPCVDLHLSDDRGNAMNFRGTVGSSQPIDNGRMLRITAINHIYITLVVVKPHQGDGF